jgi:high-affinity Fe2+/Pb2+ permease
MSDTTIIELPEGQGIGRTPFSWSAAIAGAMAATAVTFIIAALGSGIGLPFASPYSSGLSPPPSGW